METVPVRMNDKIVGKAVVIRNGDDIEIEATINDESVIEKINKGELNGYSIKSKGSIAT